jgi:hypothetical protein
MLLKNSVKLKVGGLFTEKKLVWIVRNRFFSNMLSNSSNSNNIKPTAAHENDSNNSDNRMFFSVIKRMQC